MPYSSPVPGSCTLKHLGGSAAVHQRQLVGSGFLGKCVYIGREAFGEDCQTPVILDPQNGRLSVFDEFLRSERCGSEVSVLTVVDQNGVRSAYHLYFALAEPEVRLVVCSDFAKI